MPQQQLPPKSQTTTAGSLGQRQLLREMAASTTKHLGRDPPTDKSPSSSDDDDSSSSSSDDDDGDEPAKPRKYKRQPRYALRGNTRLKRPPILSSRVATDREGDENEDDDDDSNAEPAFLPFAADAAQNLPPLNPANLNKRSENVRRAAGTGDARERGALVRDESQSSSTNQDPSATTSEGSAASGAYPRYFDRGLDRAAGKKKAMPSVGSSFSDLEGAWSSS